MDILSFLLEHVFIAILRINIKTLKLILIIAFCSISSTIQAQTTKNIALSNKGPFVDELSFKEDAKDIIDTASSLGINVLYLCQGDTIRYKDLVFDF